MGRSFHSALFIELYLICLAPAFLFLRQPGVLALSDFLERQVLRLDIVVNAEARLLQALEDRLLIELEDVLEQVV